MKLKINYRHFICVGIILLSIGLIPFCFKYAHLRIAEALYDLVDSTKYYIRELFGLNLKGNLSVNEFTKLPFSLPFNIPQTWGGFVESFNGYWKSFFNKETFIMYCSIILNVLSVVSRVLMIITPVICIMLIINAFGKNKENNNYNEDSKPLKAWKVFERKVYIPVKTWLLDFKEFVNDNRYYITIFFLVWAYSFNIISIGIEFIAYYLFFITCF